MSKPLYPGWRMTVDQHGHYWSLWRDVVKANGWDKLKNKEVSEKRRMLHERAFGGPKSATDIDQGKEFDVIKAEFLAWSKPANFNAQMGQQRQPRKRLETKIKIEQVKLLSIVLVDAPKASEVEPDIEAAMAYVSTVMLQRFGTDDISQLREEEIPPHGKSELEMLRDTLDARLTALRQTRVAKCAGISPDEFKDKKKWSVAKQTKLAQDFGWTWHDVKTAAGVECDCAACKRAKAAPVAAPAAEEVGA